PELIISPNRIFSTDLIQRFDIEVTFNHPTIGAQNTPLLKKNPRLVWTESPGSISMEVQDFPAIAEAAHKIGALAVLDNTWSAGVYFDAFAHGVDITVQALTKYVGGHSDFLLASVTVRDEPCYQKLDS